MGKIPKKRDLKKGDKVFVETRENQYTGLLDIGRIKDILTPHKSDPRGIKVRLENNVVGRVKRKYDEKLELTEYEKTFYNIIKEDNPGKNIDEKFLRAFVIELTSVVLKIPADADEKHAHAIIEQSMLKILIKYLNSTEDKSLYEKMLNLMGGQDRTGPSSVSHFNDKKKNTMVEKYHGRKRNYR